jgi:signal peptidase
VHISNKSNLYYSYNKGYDNGLYDKCSINILSPYLETKTHQKFYNANGESMYPTIQAKDLIFIDNNSSNFDHLKKGDIIIFKAVDPSLHNDTIIHRVIHIFQKGDTLDGNSLFNNLCEPMIMPKKAPDKIIMTKGDANSCSIPLADVPVTKQNYIGKVISINGKNIN